jgi:hypothetical protein
VRAQRGTENDHDGTMAAEIVVHERTKGLIQWTRDGQQTNTRGSSGATR